MDNNRPYYTKINQLARFLVREGESGYMFACARDERIIRPASEAIQRLASVKATLPVRTWRLEREELLLPQLKRAAEGAQGLIVFGLDEFLRAPDKIISFNFAREALNKLGLPLLFWATQDTLARLGNLATDLYSQRRSVNVYFDELADITVPDPFLDSRFPEHLRSAEETAQLELALDLQKKQLQEAIEARLSPRRIALDYALPLAKAYADLDGYGEALNILEAYPPGESQDWPPEKLPELGRIFRGAHRYPEALKCFEETIRHFGQTKEKQSELSIALSELGDIYKELGQLEKAQDTYIKDLELSEQLAKDNPHSEQLRRDLSGAYFKMGLILDRAGKTEEAARYLARDLEICRVLYQTNPGKIQFAEDLAVSYENLALRQPPPADAPQYRQEAERLWLELYERTGEPSFQEKAWKMRDGKSGG